VFLDVPGGTYWKTWQRYVTDHLLRRHLISKEDLSLFHVTDDIDEAVRELTRFYRTYHSLRMVGRKTVIRINRRIPVKLLTQLNRSFTDIIRTGAIIQGNALPAEADEPDIAHLPRLIMDFDRMSYGRLRQMIDALNRGVRKSTVRNGVQWRVQGTAHG
jgi:hypothetical protein